MKIKHIHITKEGEPMAIPINDDGTWSEGYLPFEDKKDALDFIPWEYHGYNGTILSQYWNTLIPAELEVEVVEQMNVGDGWVPRDYHDKPAASNVEYRSALRIKP